MNERSIVKILTGALCAVLVISAAVVALVLDSQSPDPIFGIFKPDIVDPEKDKTDPDEPVTPPTNLPSAIVIPSEKDPETGDELPD